MVEPVSLRASRTVTITMSVPAIAGATRQPAGSMPNRCSPKPMSHFPTSGCTMKLGWLVHSPWRLPARILSLALSTYPVT